MGEWTMTPETAQLLRNTVGFTVDIQELYEYLSDLWTDDIDYEIRNLLAKIKAAP